MSPHQITAVAVRLLAIWLFVLIAMNVPYYFLNTPLQGEYDSIIAFIVGSALVVLLSIALWKFPLAVASKLLSSEVKEPEQQGDPDLWLAMGCALMGLWMIASTIPWFIQSLFLAQSEFGRSYSDSLPIWLGLYLPKTVIGLWLIFGARGFRKLFWWVRTAGYAKAQQRDVDSSSD